MNDGGGRQSDGSGGPRDAGFTLVELLIVLVVLPIVVGAIAYALIATFSLQSGASHRLTNTDDAQVVASTFEKDVQSASISRPKTGASTSAARVPTPRTQWASASVKDVVSYAEVGSSTAPYSLVRNYCTAGSATPSDTTTLVFNLPANQPPPNYNCSANCTELGRMDLGHWDLRRHARISETNTDTKTGAFTYSLVATPRITSTNQPAERWRFPHLSARPARAAELRVQSASNLGLTGVRP